MTDDTIYRQAALDALGKDPGFKVKLFGKSYDEGRSDQWFKDVHALTTLPSAELTTCKYWDMESNFCALYRPSAQPEDYTELKREFIRMASYIDVLLECSDEQKETLIGFISRLAGGMPWTERD